MGRNHYGRATGKTYRLSVCLKRFFSDERARCYITADTGLHFRWLVARMRRLFGLSGPFCLVARGHLLPPDEPVGLLSPDDLVEVIPNEYKMFPNTSESDASEESENIDDLFDLGNDKSENTVPVLNPSEQAAKVDQHSHDKPVKTDAIPDQSPTERKGLQGVKIDDLQNVENVNFNNTDDGRLEDEEHEKLEAVKRKALDLLDQCSFPLKRKRKRVRRRKQCTAIQESEDNTADTEDVNDGPEKPLTSDHCTADRNHVPERSHSSQDTDTLILRNNTEHRRAARLVHSLS